MKKLVLVIVALLTAAPAFAKVKAAVPLFSFTTRSGFTHVEDAFRIKCRIYRNHVEYDRDGLRSQATSQPVEIPESVLKDLQETSRATQFKTSPAVCDVGSWAYMGYPDQNLAPVAIDSYRSCNQHVKIESDAAERIKTFIHNTCTAQIE